MTPEELKTRLTQFGIDALTLCKRLREEPAARNIAAQLSASATAIGANYRSACRARSNREFISKLSVALEEADESVGWIETIEGAALIEPRETSGLLAEARELVSILGASRRTAERRARERAMAQRRQRS